MRFYDAQFVSKAGKQLARLKLDEKNPYGVRITFNIQHFYKSSNYTPSVLSVYNPSTAFFTQSQTFKGADIIFSAGIKSSVFTKKLLITPSSSDLMYRGKIARVVPQYTGRDPCVTFLLSSIMLDETKTTTADGKEKTWMIIAEAGDKIAESIKKTLTEMFEDNNLSVKILSNVLDITLQDKQTLQRNVKNFNEVCNLASEFGISIAVEKEGVTLFKEKEMLARDSVLFTPLAQDFISQPEWQTTSSIQCVFGLRADLELGQKLQLPTSMALNAASLLSDSGSLASVSNSNAIIASGTFTVTGIWHTGDSRNSSALAWATTVSATNEKNLSNA